MILIKKIILSKLELDSIPENERVLLIQVGHFFNEVSIFHKLLIFAHKESTSGVERAVYTSQAMVIARCYVGKLLEGWKMLQKCFFGSKLSKEYENLLHSQGKDALANLKKYFSKQNIIQKIRNNYSFHYPLDDEVIKQYNTYADETKFMLFVSEHISNNHYGLCEEIVSRGMLNMIEVKSQFSCKKQKAPHQAITASFDFVVRLA